MWSIVSFRTYEDEFPWPYVQDHEYMSNNSIFSSLPLLSSSDSIVAASCSIIKKTFSFGNSSRWNFFYEESCELSQVSVLEIWSRIASTSWTIFVFDHPLREWKNSDVLHTVSKVQFLFKNWILSKSRKSSNLTFCAKIQLHSWILDSKMYQILELLGQKSRFWPKIDPPKNMKLHFLTNLGAKIQIFRIIYRYK